MQFKGTAHRYGRDIRYPGVLQTLLGDGYYVAEDGLVGRTAAFPDSNRDGRSALETLPLSIESHGPVQYIVLMLGTNDCKIDKTRSAEDVGAGMDKLVRLVIGMLPAWTKILLVAPPPLGPAAPQRAGCPPPPAAGRPGRAGRCAQGRSRTRKAAAAGYPAAAAAQAEEGRQAAPAASGGRAPRRRYPRRDDEPVQVRPASGRSRARARAE